MKNNEKFLSLKIILNCTGPNFTKTATPSSDDYTSDGVRIRGLV